MGHHSQTCAISGLDITEEDKIVAIALKQNPIANPYLRMGSNEWQPHLLPIFGEYDGYGTLVDIEENANTKAIKEATGMDAETILESILSDRNIYDSYNPLLKSLYTEFPHRFNKTNLLKMGCKLKDNVYYYEDLSFSFEKKEPSPNYFNYHVTITQDGQKTNIIVPEMAWFCRELNERFGKYPFLNEEQIKIARTHENTKVMFVLREFYDQFSTLESKNQFSDIGSRIGLINRFKNEIKKAREEVRIENVEELELKIQSLVDSGKLPESVINMLAQIDKEDILADANGFTKQFKFCSYFFIEHFVSPIIKESNEEVLNTLADLMHLRNSLITMNKTFFVPETGLQDGSEEIQKILAESIVSKLGGSIHWEKDEELIA